MAQLCSSRQQVGAHVVRLSYRWARQRLLGIDHMGRRVIATQRVTMKENGLSDGTQPTDEDQHTGVGWASSQAIYHATQARKGADGVLARRIVQWKNAGIYFGGFVPPLAVRKFTAKVLCLLVLNRSPSKSSEGRRRGRRPHHCSTTNVLCMHTLRA